MDKDIALILSLAISAVTELFNFWTGYQDGQDLQGKVLGKEKGFFVFIF